LDPVPGDLFLVSNGTEDQIYTLTVDYLNTSVRVEYPPRSTLRFFCAGHEATVYHVDCLDSGNWSASFTDLDCPGSCIFNSSSIDDMLIFSNGSSVNTSLGYVEVPTYTTFEVTCKWLPTIKFSMHCYLNGSLDIFSDAPCPSVCVLNDTIPNSQAISVGQSDVTEQMMPYNVLPFDEIVYYCSDYHQINESVICGANGTIPNVVDLVCPQHCSIPDNITDSIGALHQDAKWVNETHVKYGSIVVYYCYGYREFEITTQCSFNGTWTQDIDILKCPQNCTIPANLSSHIGVVTNSTSSEVLAFDYVTYFCYGYLDYELNIECDFNGTWREEMSHLNCPLNCTLQANVSEHVGVIANSMDQQVKAFDFATYFCYGYEIDLTMNCSFNGNWSNSLSELQCPSK